MKKLKKLLIPRTLTDLAYTEFALLHPEHCEIRSSVLIQQAADYCWGLGLAYEEGLNIEKWKKKHCHKCEINHNKVVKEGKYFWLSIELVENCLFNRRNKLEGKVIGKYNIRLKLFGKNII